MRGVGVRVSVLGVRDTRFILTHMHGCTHAHADDSIYVF